MIQKTFSAVLVCAAFVLLASGAVGQPGPVLLTIHADQAATPVSPTLYGLMTEEINYAYEGGLYAEMVRNRTFRADWSGINYWYLLEKGNAQAKMSGDRTVGPERRASQQHAVGRNKGRRREPGGRDQRGLVGHGSQAQRGVQGIVLRQGRERGDGRGDGEPGG